LALDGKGLHVFWQSQAVLRLASRDKSPFSIAMVKPVEIAFPGSWPAPQTLPTSWHICHSRRCSRSSWPL